MSIISFTYIFLIFIIWLQKVQMFKHLIFEKHTVRKLTTEMMYFKK